MSSSRTPRPLSTEEMDILSQAMAGEARQEKLNMAIAGGFAMQHHGSTRFTKDLDIISDRELDAYQYADVGLKKTGILTFGGQKFETKDGVPLDWIVYRERASGIYDDALFSAKKVPGKPYRVIPAAHLMAMKFDANRAKDHIDMRLLMEKVPGVVRKAGKIISRTLGPDAAMEFDSRIAILRIQDSPQKG
jgi:hypothetical protein